MDVVYTRPQVVMILKTGYISTTLRGVLRHQVGADRGFAQNRRHFEPEVVVTGELERRVLARLFVGQTAAAVAPAARRRAVGTLARRRRGRRGRQVGLGGRQRGAVRRVRFFRHHLAHRYHPVFFLQVLQI